MSTPVCGQSGDEGAREGVARFLAAAAGFGAGLDQTQRVAPVEGGQPRQRPAGRLTGIGAVEVEADAAHEVGQRRLAQARIGAGGTRLGAIETGLDTGVPLGRSLDQVSRPTT